MLPLHDVTAFVFGCGPICRAVRAMVLSQRKGRLTVGVNLAHLHHRFVPDVSFWIDSHIYDRDPAHFDKTLCVCDRSVHRNPEHIGLPMRGGSLPTWPNPARLYQRPNTAVVAAIWAMSLGCHPVCLVGCDCKPDGRLDRQQECMRCAKHELELSYDAVTTLSHATATIKALWRDRLKYVQRRAEVFVVDPAARIREFYR